MSLPFYRVLRSHYEERLREGPGFAIDGSLPFLHCFEEGRLCARSGAVYLVSEQHLAEYRTAAKLKVAGSLIVEVHAQHIGRHQVRRELDALEGALQRLSQRLCKSGLPDARRVLNQYMPATQQGDDGEIDGFVFAHDNALDIFAYSRCHPLNVFDCDCVGQLTPHIAVAAL
jgi:hypothetical protein